MHFSPSASSSGPHAKCGLHVRLNISIFERSRGKKEWLAVAQAAVDEGRIHRGEDDVAPGIVHERVQLGSNLLEAPKLELLSKLELLAKQRELLSLFCNDPPTCGADADATFTYSQVPLVASEARVAYDLLTKNNTSLPGRERVESHDHGVVN